MPDASNTRTGTRTGAESLIATAVEAGVEVCFANPGTTEMPLVSALDAVPGMRAVLALHENVVTGAADGYGRLAGKPALTLLHLGPGFANGIANLHNARRARTPLINLIGEHATWHQEADAPLAADIESLTGAVSGWQRRSSSADAMAGDMAEALTAATAGDGQVASLILPHDLQMAETTAQAAGRFSSERAAVSQERVAQAAETLKAGRSLLLIGGQAITEPGLKTAARIAAATGAGFMTERSVAYAERGGGLPAPAPVPYFPEQAEEALSGYDSIVLAGTDDPVAFFGWPGYRSRHAPEDCIRISLARHDEDVLGALDALADALDAPAYQAADPGARPEPPSGALTADALCQAIAALQPEGAVLVNEAITSGWSYYKHSASAPRFTQVALTGGAIGFGLSCATGAAIACPDRKVIAFQADGSGLYAPQALWTQAREGLDVVNVICANRAYHILRVELQRAGINRPGPNAESLTDLARPAVDWTQIAKGFGVPATTAETADSLVAALGKALATPGPSLIEALVE